MSVAEVLFQVLFIITLPFIISFLTFLLRKWSISSQKGYCLQSFEHHCDWVNDISLVNDGTRCRLTIYKSNPKICSYLVLSASSDTTVKVWDTQNGLYPHIDLIKYIYKDKEINKFFWRLCLRTACALSPRASVLRYYC